ncbi:hypothetical protein Tco_0447355, partial [Tanacetum coccineum]
IASSTTQTRAPQLNQNSRNTNPRVSTGVTYKTNVSRPQPRSNQMKDKVVPYTSHTKHMTGNVSLLCNFVEKYLGTVRFGNDQFAPILGYGDLVQGNITIKRGFTTSKVSITILWLKHLQLKHGYGIEGFLISTLTT